MVSPSAVHVSMRNVKCFALAYRALSEKPGNEREFSNARAFANPSPGTSGATR
jgi:hypothetical protein